MDGTGGSVGGWLGSYIGNEFIAYVLSLLKMLFLL